MRLRVVFMGSPDFGLPCLRAVNDEFEVIAVVTQPDRPRGRSRKPVPTPVKAAALELGLTSYEPEDIRDEGFLAQMRQWRPDVVVVVAYGKVLPKSILDLAPMGCVNLHASLLPRHRGASPIQGVILDGDPVGGVSTMLMDQGLDTGPILLQWETPILPDDTASSLHDRLLEPGAELMVRTLGLMMKGAVTPRAQDESLATYTRPLVKQDGIIDWNSDAESLGRLVRAMNPWPGAAARLGDEWIRIWSASPVSGEGVPGVIAGVSEDGVIVGAGKGSLLLTEVQAPGKKRISCGDFARGRRLKAGDTFLLE